MRWRWKPSSSPAFARALVKGLENKREVHAGHRVHRRRGHRQAARQQRDRSAATRSRRAGHRPRRRRSERHLDPWSARHHNDLERPQHLHGQRPRAAAAGYSRQPGQPYRRLQDARGRAARNRPRGPDRRPHAPPVRLPGFEMSLNARDMFQDQRDEIDPNGQFPGQQPLGGRQTAGSARSST